MSRQSISNLPLPLKVSNIRMDGSTDAQGALYVQQGAISAPTSSLAVDSANITNALVTGSLTANGGLINANRGLALGDGQVVTIPSPDGTGQLIMSYTANNNIQITSSGNSSNEPAQNPTPEGMYIAWNLVGGQGETDLVNWSQGGVGGFTFSHQSSGGARAQLASLSPTAFTLSAGVALSIPQAALPTAAGGKGAGVLYFNGGVLSVSTN